MKAFDQISWNFFFSFKKISKEAPNLQSTTVVLTLKL